MLSRCLVLLIVPLLAALSAAGQAPQAVQGSSAPPPPQKQAGRAVLPVFQFHSGFWVNLHHFLYLQARLRKQIPITRNGDEDRPAGPPAATPDQGKQLSAEEQHAWNAALDYYASEFAGRDLLFDSYMVRINDRLAEMGDCPDLSGRSSLTCASGLRPELIAALEQAAPIDRAHWWPEHDRANRAWTAGVTPLAGRYGAALARQLAAIYQATWPTGPIRVDVSFYAGPYGAYTSLDPLHITISSTDPRNQGRAALEVLFHEASHAVAGEVRDTIARDCREHNKPIPRDLWHALLFYTTGQIVQRTYQAAEGSPEGRDGPYTPYAIRNGLYARDWQGYERLLERYWQPYLDGQTDFSTALSLLTAAL